MKDTGNYDQEFFAEIQSGSIRSAQATLPLVLELVHPKSVIDVGCGTGTWLTVCEELGIEDIFGIDGSYVDPTSLLIPQDKFAAYDLTKPFTLERKFDLALCLEVAEHLPEEAAEGFINSLVALAPIILFSAAIPGQGGMNHVNEQWPEYWAKQFSKHNYVAIDAIRKLVWSNPQVEVWYRQNLLIFCDATLLSAIPSLNLEYIHTNLSMLSLVHPGTLEDKLAEISMLIKARL